MAEVIPLTREVEAVQIPAGTKMMLPEGLRVQVMQTLGGSFTVTTENGYMVRIDGQDADALGKEKPKLPEATPDLPGKSDLERSVWAMLKTVFDPEIPVNIVDLGLVYECKLKNKKVDIKMTMTAPGCGMGDVLKSDAETKIRNLPGVKEVNIEIVWEPAWDMSMMTESARLELGMM